MTDYTLFVDETGDTGLDKVREGVDGKGASPILVLGGCLVPESRRAELENLLSDIRETIGKKDLHCKNLKHLQMAKYSREIGQKAGVLFFSLVSTKRTMGEYKKQIAGKGQDQRYYNKCVSYFLERVGHFMLLKGIDRSQVRIVLEEREGHDYEKLRNYLRTIKKTPYDDRLGYYLAPIDPNRLVAIPKTKDNLLSLSDLAAFSVAAALNPSAANFGVPEQRYLRELKGKFFKDDASAAIGEFGLKIFKRHSLKLDATTKSFVESWHVEGCEPSMHLD